MHPLEIIAVVVSALGVWLTTRRTLLCWPVSLLSVVLYGKVFFDQRLYSDAMLQAVYAAFIFYGWWLWARGVREEGEVKVEKISAAECLLGLAAGALGSVVLGYAMARYTDAAIPWVDSSLTSFSLVAQYWLTRKYIANWWLWIVVDVAYTGVFVFKSLYLTSGLYAAFVVLAIIGVRSWNEAQRQQEVGERVATA
jgi:nicotinamide mononucleotide transporter